MNIRSSISKHIVNIPGWKTKRKFVVIESDDWGSLRIPSKDAFNKLLQMGIRVDKDPASIYDNLATANDLECLFNVLTSVKDRNGNYPILTAGTVVANPDFELIKLSGYTKYYYELFTDTLKKSYLHEGTFDLWLQGIQNGIFRPQFHGREHLNVLKWLKDLQNDAPLARIAFDLNTYSLSDTIDKRIKRNYLGAFDSSLQNDLDYYETVIEEGLLLFENLFGYKSESFIPTRYTYDNRIESVLIDNNVKYMQGIVLHLNPLDGGDKFKYSKRFVGKYSDNGLLYLMRNCFFEPSLNQNFDWVDDCLKRIEIAFLWNKPATICTHRLNFIGSFESENRNRNLKLLEELLIKIVKNFPDVEFVSSDQLGKIIEDDIK